MLFISHKTEDKAIANEVLRRVLERGYSDKQIFLDSDPGSGIEAGAAWERMIYESLKHTRAMIVLCSPNWLKSQWCFVELGYAKAMAISVFPIVIEKCDVGSTLSATQAIDLTTATDAVAREAAFERLWTALEEQHLGPKDNLPWPPPGEEDNCPFPGLMYFDEKHAPVFFGREQERDTVIKQLKEMRSSGVPRLLMIVGGSGSGKSSLLRAGVLPWLRHPTEQRDWLVLPTLRYGETPSDDVTLLARLAEVIADRYPKNHPRRPDWKEFRDKFEADDVEQAARDFIDATVDLCQAQRQAGSQLAPASDQAPTTLLVIDQFEELLTAAARPSAQNFLRFLRTLLSRSNGRLLVIGTMRSDYLDTYEQHAESLKPPFLDLYRLPPFPWERVTEVIVKPAERVDVTFTEELISRLKGDAPNSDALPLLAFTLEKLFRQCASDKLIELREYEQLGGMSGAITQAVTRILPNDLPKETEQAVRRSFVNHLAQVNEKDEFVRRRALWETLPDAAKPLLEEFVRRERLLQRSGNKGELVEVTHEAIFRCWDTLKDWLRTSADILRWRRDVSRDRASDKTWTGLRPVQLAVARHWPQQRRDELTEDEVTWIRHGIFWERFRRGVVGTVVLVISALAIVAELARLDSKRNLITSRLRLAESEIQQGQLARGIFSYWQAYEGTRIFPNDPRPQRARSLIGSLSRRLGQPLLHDGLVYAIAFSPDGKTVITGCSDNAARLWDVETYEPRGPLLSHQGQVLAVAFSPDGKRVLTGSADKTAQLWDAHTGTPLRELLGHKNRILAVAFSPDGQTAITGSADATAQLWDAQTGKPKGDPLKHKGWVSSVAFRPKSSTVLTGSFDKYARLWNADTGELLAPLKHEGWVSSVAFSRDGKTLLTGSFDKTARLWDAATGQSRGEPLRHERWVNAAAFSPDDETVLTGSSDKTARLWDVPSAKSMWHQESVVAVAFSPNGKKVLTGSWDWRARLWDADTGELLHVLLHERGANAVAFSPDGRTLLTGSYDKKVRLWDADTGALRRELKHGEGLTAHDDGVTAVAFSPKGETVLTGSYDETARLWDADTGELRRTLQHGDGVTAVAFSPDGQKVLTGSADKTARLWDAQTGKLLLDKMRHEDRDGDGITTVAFSADGETVLTGSYDGTARLWDAGTGQHQRTLRHDDWVTAVAFSPNSQRVLTGSFDGTARLWDARTGQPWGEPLRHEEPVFAVAFSPSEGEDWKMLTGSRNKTARIWVQSIPAADEPVRLRLSVEVRTTYTLDRDGNRKRLTQAEWLDRRKKLTELGGRCDVRIHEQLSKEEQRQLERPPIN